MYLTIIIFLPSSDVDDVVDDDVDDADDDDDDVGVKYRPNF